jgi:hypothetical protein
MKNLDMHYKLSGYDLMAGLARGGFTRSAPGATCGGDRFFNPTHAKERAFLFDIS